MLTFEEMLLRLLLAVALGAVIGIERELAGKAAGIRTDILVAAGAAIFAMIGLSLPYLVAVDSQNLSEVIARNSGFLTVIANIVVGVGFLGAGIIIKEGMHVYGVTTAATVWLVAAIGTLAGIGLTFFAVASAAVVMLLLAFLSRVDVQKLFRKKSE